MAKIGINGIWQRPRMDFMTLVIIDNTHLTAQGMANLAAWVGKAIIATRNGKHPAFSAAGNVEAIHYEGELDLKRLLADLKRRGIDRITIQSGAALNAEFLRAGLVDYVSLFVAPMIVGGRDTPSLAGGESLVSDTDLAKIRTLRLESADVMKDSYLHLTYKVINNPAEGE
jgi:2,5-diamino-6-(ribosylamino)-4(3H)-pyrimidinone 5'-phosphate reductase